MIYRIRCHVWGGITGDRVSWLKDSDQSIWKTSNKKEAQTKVNKLNKEYNSPHAKAYFNYKVMGIKE